MKKIVAVVLALVMALGLSTVAFAAGATGTGYTALNEFADLGTGNYGDWTASYEIDKGDAEDGEFDVWEIELVARVNLPGEVTLNGQDVEGEEIGDDVGLDGKYVQVTGDVADVVDLVLAKGKEIIYLAEMESGDAYDTGFSAEAKAAHYKYVVDEKTVCDTFYAKTLELSFVTYYEFDGGVYAETDAVSDTSKTFVVDGKAVIAEPVGIDFLSTGTGLDNEPDDANPLYWTGHYYKLDGVGNTYDESNVTKVYCHYCGKSFEFLPGTASMAYAAYGANNYEAAAVLGDVTYWVNLASGAAADKDAATDAEGDKVTSAETFDAGIAMYVGMSVMAAAGSAVVLKKKD